MLPLPLMFAALLLPHLPTQSTAAASPQLSSDPSPLVLYIGSTQLANLTLTDFAGNFTCSVQDTGVANVSDIRSAGNWTVGNSTFSVELFGRKFGWTFLACVGGAGGSSAKLQVTVLQESGVLDIVYRVLLIVFVIAIVFCMGASVEIRTVLKLIKRPVALSIGLVCQFILMPHLGLAVGQLMLLAMTDIISPNALAFGFLTFGCAPGGGNSNMYTFLLDGDVDLSVTMTFFSQLFAFFMMPLWLFAYSRLYIDPTLVRIPFDQVAYTLLQSVVPVVLGVLVRFKWPEAGKKITKAIVPMSVLFIITVIGLGSYTYLYLLELMRDYPLLFPFAAMLPWLGFLLAFLVASACRLSRPQAIAVAIECGVQNAGIPIQLLLFSMPKPEGDIASIVPVAVIILTPLPLVLAVVGHRIRKRYRLGDAGKTAEGGTLQMNETVVDADADAPGGSGEGGRDNGGSVKGAEEKDANEQI